MKNVSDKSCRETRNARLVYNNLFFPEKRVLYIMEKYCSEGQATDDNMAHAHCMLDT